MRAGYGEGAWGARLTAAGEATNSSARHTGHRRRECWKDLMVGIVCVCTDNRHL
jgi:hypothetical protein